MSFINIILVYALILINFNYFKSKIDEIFYTELAIANS